MDGAELLLSEADYAAARRLRDSAHVELRRLEQRLQQDAMGDSTASPGLIRQREHARSEYALLNRVCLRHAARRLDAQLRADGKESDLESAIILWDITHPIRGT